MKAVIFDRYGGPDRLSLAEVPVPEPQVGEIRVRVLACGVNLSDWEYLVGSPFYARLAGGLRRPNRPVLGSDIVGVVDKVPRGIAALSPGQRVMGDVVMSRGGFAEYACVPASEMVEVPEGLGDDIAACLPQAGGIAVAGTEDLAEGMRFLINGAGGGSGTMALQLAKAAGAWVTAVDNAGKTDWLGSLGADEAIDYRAVDFAATGETWDRILDMVATRGPIRVSKALSEFGVYRAVGGKVRVLLPILLVAALRFGPLRWWNKSVGMLIVPSGQELTRRVAEMAVEGRLAPHLEAVLPLSDVPEALRRTGAGEVKGKLVIRPRPYCSR